MKRVIVLFLLLAAVYGCTEDGVRTVTVEPDDFTPPPTPRGVYSVTGDGYVFVAWYGEYNPDLSNIPDLDGFLIYRAREWDNEYILIAEVGREEYSYTDYKLQNGSTYYYAVSAIDFTGNESELSYELKDTPRPAGKAVMLVDYFLQPEFSGFDFSRYEAGHQPYNLPGVDIYFGVDVDVRVPYIYSDNGTEMQDLGWTESMDDIDVSPKQGFTSLFVEAIVGHTYAFRTPDAHYAKIRITDMRIEWGGFEDPDTKEIYQDVVDSWITFDWAYQLQPDNPELAPRRANSGFNPSHSTWGGTKNPQ